MVRALVEGVVRWERSVTSPGTPSADIPFRTARTPVDEALLLKAVNKASGRIAALGSPHAQAAFAYLSRMKQERRAVRHQTAVYDLLLDAWRAQIVSLDAAQHTRDAK
jgi:hypothetical protein